MYVYWDKSHILCVQKWSGLDMWFQYKGKWLWLSRRLEIFVTLFAGLTLRGQDGLFKMDSLFCVPLFQRYGTFYTLYMSTVAHN